MSERTRAKIAEYVAHNSRWLRLKDKQTGRCRGYAIPSESREGLYHLTNGQVCDCQGFRQRGWCSHQLAAAEYIELKRSAAGQPAPTTASTTTPAPAPIVEPFLADWTGADQAELDEFIAGLDRELLDGAGLDRFARYSVGLAARLLVATPAGTSLAQVA